MSKYSKSTNSVSSPFRQKHFGDVREVADWATDKPYVCWYEIVQCFSFPLWTLLDLNVDVAVLPPSLRLRRRCWHVWFPTTRFSTLQLTSNHGFLDVFQWLCCGRFFTCDDFFVHFVDNTWPFFLLWFNDLSNF